MDACNARPRAEASCDSGTSGQAGDLGNRSVSQRHDVNVQGTGLRLAVDANRWMERRTIPGGMGRHRA
ncbi:hypothetical protein CJO78_20975 (plasmid) [Ralstonia solanacearum]|nr:hypothetical protein CJO78_20975 [Ralstonia solanacearum]AXW08252.1 hypothetical protein CJO82_20645 [Ralstonia solanacearum]AXW26042.1 hypothetical protein CJO86_20910 [Ralstonia solanacearum]AXW64178.1 hypothetical protein CJO94_20855 [Ralstonia solanacearum]AXW82952.1 hypothetical protein CJO98_21005 [Ralstonia solanacearum]